MSKQTMKLQSIYKSRNNILAYLKEQNFNIDEYNNFSINEIYTISDNNQLDMLLERNENINDNITRKKVYVKYHLDKSLRDSNIQEFIDDLFNLEQILTKDDDLIIIIKDSVNDTLIKDLRQRWAAEKHFVIVWDIKHLQFNILNHYLVPKHIVLNSNENIEFRKRYNIINDKNIPDISRFSPVAMAIGIRPGEVCKIIRSSKTAITSNFYRICSA